MFVGADDRLFVRFVAVFVDVALVQTVDQFQLVGLVGEELAGLAGADLAVGKIVPAADNLAHPLLDRFQILRPEGARGAVLRDAEIKIVIEAVLDRRSDRILGLRIKFQHRLRHYVGCAMANLIQAIDFTSHLRCSCELQWL